MYCLLRRLRPLDIFFQFKFVIFIQTSTLSNFAWLNVSFISSFKQFLTLWSPHFIRMSISPCHISSYSVANAYMIPTLNYKSFLLVQFSERWVSRWVNTIQSIVSHCPYQLLQLYMQMTPIAEHLHRVAYVKVSDPELCVIV